MFDPLVGLEEAVEKLAVDGVSDPDEVVRLRALIERLECVWTESVRAVERSGAWEAQGYVSTAAWLRDRCRLTHGAAARVV